MSNWKWEEIKEQKEFRPMSKKTVDLMEKIEKSINEMIGTLILKQDDLTNGDMLKMVGDTRSLLTDFEDLVVEYTLWSEKTAEKIDMDLREIKDQNKEILERLEERRSKD